MEKSGISVSDLAALIGVSRGTIYHRMKFGDLPAGLTNHFFGQGRTHQGRRFFFDAYAVEIWREAYRKKWDRD